MAVQTEDRSDPVAARVYGYCRALFDQHGLVFSDWWTAEDPALAIMSTGGVAQRRPCDIAAGSPKRVMDRAEELCDFDVVA